ncbi:MAG: hypothetical protein CFE21_05000 [Bacteroidetes bacterium B1(2017)]|nr:MAG: hypothetical protein CFE21_05000 [Bacteroidetes bacterium B1(2017)]
MATSDQKLNEVTVEGTQIRVEQKGDTTSINAGAYKVNPDATAEDLVKKMPGISVENGTVKAQGEDVKKILVDGKEFFGDDAQMALKNLPAEVVDKVQVFNRLGDQAQFTGFNDGNTDKTMNITTKSGKNNGKFGKVYAGYGTDDRYQAGLNLNLFKGDRRITVLGLSNNINQQNFSMQDLFGGSAGGGQRMPMGGGGGGRMGGGGSGGMGDMSNFFVGQQSGISLTNSIGMNYSDKWGTKTNVSGSYFFNNSSTSTDKVINRTYLINPEVSQLYKDSTGSVTDNFNNRFNLRLEHTFDSFNSIIYTPRVSFQNNSTKSDQFAGNFMNDTMLNATFTNKHPVNTGYTISNNLLLRHKFEKLGRTISLNLGHDLNRKKTETDQYSDIFAIDTAFVLNKRSIKQQSKSITNGTTYSTNLTYTEQLTKVTQLQVSYNPSYTQNYSEKLTNKYDSISNEYVTKDTLLSNTFDNTVSTHKANVSVNINKEKYSLTAGITQQFLTLASIQSYPTNRSFDKTFSNLLPSITYQYKFTNSKTLRLVYRTNTNTPSVTQLQNVIDNSNPLLLSAGNPSLRQEYSHTFVTRYGINNPHNSQTFFVFAMASLTNDYIANGTYTATRDSVLPNGVVLGRGAQISQPVNLNGNVNARSFATYGIPVKSLKSNVNLNLGVNYSKVPGQVNQKLNYANTFNIVGGVVIGSNISERVDFTMSHNANINLVKNTLLVSQSSNYFINTSNFKINVMPTKSIVLNTELNYTNYQGLGSSFNSDFLLWNAAVAYKFMKRMAEVKLSVFDIMKQNNSISRTVTETYIEDTRSNVLQRYFMLTFTYNIRKFSSMPTGATPTK